MLAYNRAMNYIGPIVILLITVVYVFREWKPASRFLIPLAIVLALMVLLEPESRRINDLYTYGIPVKAQVLNTRCYSASMDVHYSYEAKNKLYYGEFRDWDCGEVKAGEYLDLVYLSRAPDIHTLAPVAKPSGRSSDFLFASIIYFFLFAINAIVKADRAERAKESG